MHGLILAGGEATRLKADGLQAAKPLLEVAGVPLIVRLADTLSAGGCESLTLMVRNGPAEEMRRLRDVISDHEVRIIACETPSSLHTLAQGLAALPEGPILCTMIDTVMEPPDWARAIAETARRLADGADVVLTVTPHVDDEKPLYVGRDSEGRILRIANEPIEPLCITGGVYGFGVRARQLAQAALDAGRERMRSFLVLCAEDGLRIECIEIERIIDIDRRSDLAQASAWLSGPIG